MPERDDRILMLTRVLIVLVIPILAGAGLMLYLRPDATEQLWAWPMGPPMTALAVGGGYLAGAVLFVLALRRPTWHAVGIGFLAATPLTILLLLATLLHWELFSHEHPSFWTWLVVYLATPILLPLAWWRNRVHDPGVAPAGTPMVPRTVRLVVGTAGAMQLAIALVLFASPRLADDLWPWAVTPLTTRTLCAFLAFIAVVWMAFFVEPRWSALRLPIQGATAGLVLVAAGVGRASGDLVPGVRTVVFVAILGGAILGLLALLVGMRRLSLRTADWPARIGPDGSGPGRQERPS